MTVVDLVLVGLAAVAAGAVNALAGGGTLISFPVLTFVGVPAVAANVTNTVALCPGFVGGIFAQRRDLAGQSRRLWLALPIGALGGIAGGLLLLHTNERAFRTLIPYLILLASGLLAAQERLRRWLVQHPEHHARQASLLRVTLPVGSAAIYGGYFGAGLGVILLAVLGLTLDDTLTRLNALKQTIALAVNLAAAILFLFSGQVVWSAGLVMAAGALIGGSLGGRLAGRVRPATLRTAVVVFGVVIAVIYLVR
ncbi:MAG: sulfite exporter TauE/SafE family protein [Vicinamibacterales bacterium]